MTDLHQEEAVAGRLDAAGGDRSAIRLALMHRAAFRQRQRHIEPFISALEEAAATSEEAWAAAAGRLMVQIQVADREYAKNIDMALGFIADSMDQGEASAAAEVMR